MLLSPFLVSLFPQPRTLVDIAIVGIALFTYHKYRKTINSSVAFDEHGNIVQLDCENLSNEGLVYDYDVELTASSYDARTVHSSVSVYERTLCAWLDN